MDLLRWLGEREGSDVIAALAFVVSAVALLRPWWAERAAEMEVRDEVFRGAGVRDASHRIVIVNHGPAVARNVRMIVTNSEGDVFTPTWVDPPLATEITRLHPRQEFHFGYLWIPGSPKPASARLDWEDRRPGQQTEHFSLSRRHVI